MRDKIERLLIAANHSMDLDRRLEYKRDLFEGLLKEYPDVLVAMEHDK